MSYKDETFEFLPGKTTVVTGTNKDAFDSGRSNGSGKSTLTVDAVFFALTGESLRGLRVPSMVRRGMTDGSVEFVMEEVSTGEIVLIKRKISTSKTSKVVIQIGDSERASISVPDAGKQILDLLKLSKDDLRSSFIISKENDSYKPFFAKTDGQLKSFINSLSNIDQVDVAFVSIKSKVKELESTISGEEHHLSEMKGAIGLLEARISSSEPEDRIKEIEEDVARMKVEVGLKSGQYEDMTPFIESLNKKVEKLDTDSSIQDSISALKIVEKRISENLTKQQSTRTKVVEKINEANAAISKANAQIKGAINCPKCSHEFVLNADIESLRKIVSTNQAILKKLNPMKDLVDSKIFETRTEIEANRTEVREREKLVENQARELRALQNEITQAGNAKESLNAEIQSLERLIDLRIAEMNKAPGGKSDKADMEDLMEQFASKEKKVIDLREQLQDVSEYESRFKSFKNHLTRKVIDTLNIKVNMELKKINPSLMVSMSGFKTDSKGKVSEKIEARILQDGEFIGNYRTLSGGEKSELNLSSIMATNKITLELSEGGFDFMALDEILEKLDPDGCYRCFDYLSKQGKTISVINHAPVEKQVEGAIYVNVEKFNKISRIV